MPFKKRYIKKRKTFRKKTAYRKRRPQRRVKKGVYLFTRTRIVNQTVFDKAWDPIATAQSLTDVPNYTEFTALYDQYKICGIKYTFMFNKNTATLGTTAQDIPFLYTVYDNNDSNGLGSQLEAVQYANFKANQITYKTTRYLRPFITQPIGSSPTQVRSIKSPWLSTQTDPVPHFGLKCALSTSQATTGLATIGSLQILVKYYSAFKTPK